MFMVWKLVVVLRQDVSCSADSGNAYLLSGTHRPRYQRIPTPFGVGGRARQGMQPDAKRRVGFPRARWPDDRE